MSCTSPLTVASTTVPLPPWSDFSMCGSRNATAVFIVSADWSTKGSCISPEAKRSPTTFIPASKMSLTISSAPSPDPSASVEVALEPVAVAVDDALAQPLVDRPVGVVVRGARVDLDPLEEGQQLLQRVVVVGAPVVDEVEADLLGPLLDPRQRQDLRRVHDGRVEAGLHALVQEHRVEHLAGRRVEPERHVGQAQDRRHPRQLGLDRADALDRLDAVEPALLHAGRQRQRQRVEQEVLGRQPVALDGDVADVAGRPQLPLGRAGLALLVDAGAHDGGAELAGQPQERVQPGPRLVALLEVDRVQDRPAADPLQRGPHDRSLGGVDHERHGRLRAQPAGHLGHVGHAVGARVVDADVDQVRALLHLVLRHGDAGVPVARQHRLAERLGPVGVRALAHHQERGVLLEGHRGVDGRRRPARAPACAPRSSAPAQRSTTAARCSGVVPQQPPIAETPNSVTKRCRCSARPSGVRS